ncbi:hypothetical protein D3C85_1887940 [compost metagenome]
MTGGNLSDFTVSLGCSQRDNTDEAGTAFSLFRLEATAGNGTPDGRVDYAWRRLTATVER